MILLYHNYDKSIRYFADRNIYNVGDKNELGDIMQLLADAPYRCLTISVMQGIRSVENQRNLKSVASIFAQNPNRLIGNETARN